MEKRIDCRGLACPQPVLETRKALDDAEELLVLVDNPTSRENVKRFAESQGHKVSVAEEKGVFTLKIEKQKGGKKPSPEPAQSIDIQCPSSLELVVFIESDSMGRGSEELGRILMQSFLQTLEQSDVRPKKVILINNGVKLACQGSEVLEDLQELSAKGAEILACGTCLDFLGLKDKLLLGKPTNMYEIMQSMAKAAKIVSPY